MDILDVDRLRKVFKHTPVVDGISFAVKKGEIVGLLGPNGAGKTTTIAMILGVTTPSSGSIRIFGMDTEKYRSEILTRMNYSSAYVKAPSRMKVIEHLRVFAGIYHVANPEDRIAELLSVFRLTEYKDMLAGDLSSGNMAKVNLAKAFINRPELILLDEPTSSLDPDVSDYVRTYILDVQKNSGTTILITSHNMAEIEELCDRVIFINHGKIIDEGTPEQLSKKIDVARVRLMMRDGQKRTISYCKREALPITVTDRTVIIEVKEHDIAGLLSDLAGIGVSYSQISIDTPTLEDYFLSEVRL